ncbi:hypothetical protein VTK26DRAFT_5141 [Humicola hyalothermophila]
MPWILHVRVELSCLFSVVLFCLHDFFVSCSNHSLSSLSCHHCLMISVQPTSHFPFFLHQHLPSLRSRIFPASLRFDHVV